jgi:hypothetical protein
MPRLIRLATLALLAAAAACGERGAPTQPPQGLGAAPAPSAVPGKTTDERATRERLAHRLARAMSDPGFRAYVKSELDRSTIREHKVQFQRFLGGGNRGTLREVARLNDEPEASIETDARQAIPLELYLPVPTHRARWTGDENILVATQREDGEAPVAYDVRGHRQLLRADAPPDTPVLALVPVETDFDHPSTAPFICCAGGGPTPPAGLYMTSSHFVQDFEGWLKGSPEYEIHILGQSGATDSLTSYQCAGEHAGGYYAFDQNNLDWSGSVLLFSQAQLDAYRSQHPGQNFRIVAFEDDDGACSIRLDGARFKAFQTTLQNNYPNLTGSKDTTSGALIKIVKRANALQKILRAAYSFITSQDDLIGNAIEDVVVGEYHTGFNWIVRGENNVTNGWLKLQMR